MELALKKAIGLGIILLLCACGDLSHQESTLDYGRMRDGNLLTLTVPKATNYLTYVKPGGTIFVCEMAGQRLAKGPYGQNIPVRQRVVEALGVWLSALKRESSVNIAVTDDCKQRVPDGSALVSFQFGDNVICNNALAFTRPFLPLVDRNRYGANIFYCDDWLQNYNSQDYYALSLHELGHAFGLCDQYGSENGTFKDIHMNENCDYKIRSELPPYSVMNAGLRGDLTDDDKLGVRLLSCLESSEPADSEWATWKQNISSFSAQAYIIQFPDGSTSQKKFQTEISRLRQLGTKFLKECW